MCVCVRARARVCDGVCVRVCVCDGVCVRACVLCVRSCTIFDGKLTLAPPPTPTPPHPTPSAFRWQFEEHMRGRAAAFRPGGPAARKLARMPVCVQIGDTVRY